MNKLENPKPSAKTRWLSWAGTLLGLGFLGLALWVFSRTLSRYNFDEVVGHLKDIPVPRLILAGCFACLSYLIQASYDYVGAASLKLGIGPGRALLAGFIGNALTNNIGFSLLTGTSVRYRFYLAWGIPALAIAQIVVLAKLAFANGLFVFSGLTQILDPVELPEIFSLNLSARVLGWFILLPAMALLVWTGFSRSTVLKWGKVEIPKPSLKTLGLQIILACLHFVPAAFTLYFLLPEAALSEAGFAFPWLFIGTFMAIKFAVMFFPVPGSLGVWEGTAMAMLTPALHDYAVLGALLGYRLIYYLMPFALALVTLVFYELFSRHGLFSKLLGRFRPLPSADKKR